MYAKTLLILVALGIVFYVFTRPREGMCAATAELTAAAIQRACIEQHGVYDSATNTCNCPNGTV